MSADPVPLSDMPVCTVQLYLTCMLGSFIQIHVFVKCFFIRQAIWYVTNPPDMPTGNCGSHGVVKIISLDAILNIYQILSDASAASMGCYKDDVCNSRISKINILHANLWSLSVSGKILSYFCNKLPFWRPFCLHSYFIYIFLLEAKCLQLDSNFKEKIGFRHFSISHNVFSYDWPPIWTPSWIYRNAQRCQSSITLFFKHNICTTRINKEKSLKSSSRSS